MDFVEDLINIELGIHNSHANQMHGMRKLLDCTHVNCLSFNPTPQLHH